MRYVVGIDGVLGLPEDPLPCPDFLFSAHELTTSPISLISVFRVVSCYVPVCSTVTVPLRDFLVRYGVFTCFVLFRRSSCSATDKAVLLFSGTEVLPGPYGDYSCSAKAQLLPVQFKEIFRSVGVFVPYGDYSCVTPDPEFPLFR
ncbi:unnamed protein product [Lota lota]